MQLKLKLSEGIVKKVNFIFLKMIFLLKYQIIGEQLLLITFSILTILKKVYRAHIFYDSHYGHFFKVMLEK